MPFAGRAGLRTFPSHNPPEIAPSIAGWAGEGVLRERDRMEGFYFFHTSDTEPETGIGTPGQ